MVKKELIYQFVAGQKLGVVSTVSPDNKPGAAVVGIAISETLEIIFDTITASRKYRNILNNPHVAFAIGWDEEVTVQYEGIAEVLGDSSEADRLREIYYKVYPDGRERAANWPGLVHISVTPKWIRYSNFNNPALIGEVIF
jgi:general stress protein 26